MMTNEIPWRTDEHGILLGARVHDATLVKLIISKERLVFEMRRLSGELVTVELLGLGTFTVQELWDMPIVSEFWAWKVGSIPEKSWSIPDGPWNVLFSTSRMKPSDARREAAKIAQTRPDAFLVQLVCSLAAWRRLFATASESLRTGHDGGDNARRTLLRRAVLPAVMRLGHISAKSTTGRRTPAHAGVAVIRWRLNFGRCKV